MPIMNLQADAVGHSISQTNLATEPFLPIEHLPWSIFVEHSTENGDGAEPSNSTGEETGPTNKKLA